MNMLIAAAPISLASVALGLTAVGSLYAIHHLRRQPRYQKMATLIFWKESVRQQKTRVPWSRRFSHLWTFLLLSLIVLLLAGVLSADRWNKTDSSNSDVVVVDVGSSMGSIGEHGNSVLQNAAAAVSADVSRMNNVPALIAAGDQPALLCSGREAQVVFQRRLSRVAPISSASDSSLALELAGSLLGESRGTIYWYTDHRQIPAGLPVNIAKHVQIRPQGLPTQAVAVTGVTYELGENSSVEGIVRVHVAGRAGNAMTITASEKGAVLATQSVKMAAPQTEITFGGIPADGQILSLGLQDAPGPAAQHQVQFQLPKRIPLKFFIVGVIPRPLRDVLSAIGSIEASPQGCISVVAPGDDVPGGSVGAIQLTPGKSTDAAREPIQIASPAEPWLEAIDFEGAATTATGSISSPGCRSILSAGDTSVAGLADTSSGKRLYLMTSLVDETAELPRRAAFPVLMYRLACEMAGWTQSPPLVTSLRKVEDPLWQKADDGISVVYDPPLLAGNQPDVAWSAPTQTSRGPNAWQTPWGELLLAAGLALLIAEGFLLAGKKIV
jgi:hypothetical protein